MNLLSDGDFEHFCGDLPGLGDPELLLVDLLSDGDSNSTTIFSVWTSSLMATLNPSVWTSSGVATSNS